MAAGLINGGNGNGGGPWWARLIQSVGPTAAIAIFLVYCMAVQLPSRMEKQDSAIENNSSSIRDMAKMLMPHIGQTRIIAEEVHTQTAVQVQQCINDAENHRDKIAENRCWSAWAGNKPVSDATDPSLMPPTPIP